MKNKKSLKKKVLVSTLVLGLSLAVYLNWQFSSQNGDFTVSDILSNEKHYGESLLVGGEADDKECELLINARINRDSARAEAREAIASVLADTTLDENSISELTAQTAKISAAIEMEGKIESIIKSKGLGSVVYITDSGANVTVEAPNGLTNAQAVQIQEAVISVCSIKAEKIVIVEVK